MALRFNPAPGWPPVPAGWQPPEGWQPPPDWPPAPPGWSYWASDRTATPWPALVAAAGGAAIVLGSALEFVSQPDATFFDRVEINPAAMVLSGVFGVVLGALGLGMLSRAPAVPILALIGAILGLLGYAGFATAGAVGVPSDGGGGGTVTWEPGPGLWLSIVGCLVVLVAAIAGIRTRR